MIDSTGKGNAVAESCRTLYSSGAYRVQVRFYTVLLFLFLGLPATRAQQQSITASIHLHNGLIRTARIHSANNNGVMWSDRGSPAPQLMPHDQIAVVDFPAPDLWDQGNDYFNKGDFSSAIAAFSSLANDPRNHFHPTPGNYTSLALLRLIDCYRETGDAKAIVRTAAKLDAKSLPDFERSAMEVISAWAELGKGNYEAALTKAEAITPNPISPGRHDLGFIKAICLEKTGKTQEAIIAYGTAYTVDFGGSRELAKRAMQNAILLLLSQGKDSREGELHSLVHAYAKVYNQGKLWEGAPAGAVELLDTELETPASAPQTTTEAQSEAKTMEKPEAEEKEQKGAKPTAEITITRAGKGTGYDIIGDGTAGSEATAFRSPDVKKSFDVDGDNIYGTEGLFMFGDSGKPGNGEKFSRHTQVGAGWATFAAGQNLTSVALNNNQGPLDNPTLPPEAAVEDWSNPGVGIAVPKGRSKNPWIEILTFSISEGTPQKFRIGIISGTHAVADGRWDPESLRITAGAASAAVSGLQNNRNGHPNWVFFDVDLKGKKTGKFAVTGKLRPDGKGAVLTGITFDVPASQK